MEKIHKGIGFSATINVSARVGALLAAENTLYIILRSPSTDKQASASTAEVSYAISGDGAAAEPKRLTIGITAAVTATLAVGAYCLEIYKADKSAMLYYKADFAFCIPSSADGQNTTTPVTTDENITPDEGEDGLTIQDVLNYIEETAQNNPLE